MSDDPIILRDEPPVTRRVPPFRDVIIVYLLAGSVLLLVGSLVQELDLLIGLLVTELALVVAPPLLYVWWYRYRLRPTFYLAPISVKTALLTILTAGSAFFLIGLVAVAQQILLPHPQEYQDLWQQTIERFAQLPFVVTVSVIAVLPGVCEEFLFRGFVLSAAQRRYPPQTAILLSGGLFGLFHFDPYRLLSTTLLGVFFAYLVVRTGSILPGIIAHTTNNLMAVLLSASAYLLQRWHLLPTASQTISPLTALLTFGITLLILVAAPLVFLLGIRALPKVEEQQVSGMV